MKLREQKADPFDHLPLCESCQYATMETAASVFCMVAFRRVEITLALCRDWELRTSNVVHIGTIVRSRP